MKLQVKDGGTHTLPISPIKSVEVTEATILHHVLENGKVGYQVLFIEPNQNYYEPVLISDAVEYQPAIEADPENNIPASPEVPAKDAEYDICNEPEFFKHGYYPFEPIECAANDPHISQKCYEAALAVLGNNWELVP